MIQDHTSNKKNIDQTRNYSLEEIKQNELMSRKHKKVRTTLNSIEDFLILAFQFFLYFNFCYYFLVFL